MMRRFIVVVMVLLCLMFSACHVEQERASPDLQQIPDLIADTPNDVPTEDNSLAMTDISSEDVEFTIELLHSFSTKETLLGSVKLLENEILFTKMNAGNGFGSFEHLEVVSLNKDTMYETNLGFQTIDPQADDTNYYYIKMEEDPISGKEIISRNKLSAEEEVLVSYTGTENEILSGLAYSDGYLIYYLSSTNGEAVEHISLMCIDVEQKTTHEIDTLNYVFSPYLRPDVSNGYVTYVNVDTDGEWFYDMEISDPRKIEEQAVDFDVKTVRLNDMRIVAEFSQPFQTVSFFTNGKYLVANNNANNLLLYNIETKELRDIPVEPTYTHIIKDKYLLFMDTATKTIVIYDIEKGEVSQEIKSTDVSEKGSWVDEFSVCEETGQALFVLDDIYTETQDLYLLNIS